ncbi:helix-turn-helix transcriptional regulator [Actinocorallia sp. A-T 12471]|uniref:helix-turn-helix domain-containing protein n=1 Tax=Actinocorallia sp. A-T 12471 TaxID=3089813 RepID=UPI0029CC7D0E|nr:helix-turn-helix transcriptional regulator [Actinocorallia sp. A-T 12471]MDX6743393.1 helix-turn-helix transcriptional regulator [Actinocorallia sp. A-T 12471]
MSQIFQIPEESPVPEAQHNLHSHFADTLRVLRQLKGVTQLDVARGIFVARETYTGWENQRALPDNDNCESLDGFFGTGEYVLNLREQCRREHVASWFEAFSEYEAKCRELRSYVPFYIPGALQTEGYIRAISGAPVDEERLAMRLARKDKLLRPENPAHFFAVIDEAALIRTWRRPAAIREQLASLLEMGALPNVHIQVTRLDVPAHAGGAGALTIATMPDRSRAGWVEAQFGGRLIQDHNEICDLALVFDEIRGVALSEEASLAYIEQIMEMMHGDRVA